MKLNKMNNKSQAKKKVQVEKKGANWKKELLKSAQTIKPQMSIGKNGLTAGTIQLLTRLIEQQGIVKIKLLRSFLETHEKEESAKQLSEFTKTTILKVVGNVVILVK